MFNEKRIAVIIPAKGKSIRVESKNLKKIAGLTLIERKVKQLKESKLIDDIYVGSDSYEILAISEAMGAKPILRDPYVCDEERASANEMISDLVGRIDTDVILWAHCTNPFVDSAIYDDALRSYFENLSEFDSLVSVTQIKNHFWFEGRPLNFDPNAKRHQLASTLKPIFYQNGAIFIQDIFSFRSNSYFYGRKPYLFEIPELLSFDINTTSELEMARLLEKNKELLR